MRDKPAVVYPASDVDSVVVRADMESASPLRQSLQAAGKLPVELSASNGVGVSRCAMMGDQSLRKGGWVNGQSNGSCRHCISGAFQFLFHARHHACIRFAIPERSIANARQLVGQRTGCLVMVGSALDRQRPVPQAVDLSSGRMRHTGRAQHRPRPMGEQHAQVTVAALGNAPEMARAARRMFLGRKAKPAGEVARILEVADLTAGGRHHGGCRQQADAGNRQQRGAGRRLFGKCCEFAFELGNAGFEQADFLHQQRHRATDQSRHGGMRIGQDATDLFQAVAAPSRNGNTELPTEAAQGIDARGAGAHPERTGAVQALQGLLFDGFDFNRRNIGAAGGLQQGAGIGGIGLVALDVGTDVSGRQQLDFDAQAVEPTPPVMGRAAGFHDDQGHCAVAEPFFELTAGQTMLLGDMPGAIGNGKLKDGFGQINGHSSSIHGGLLSLKTDLHSQVDQCVCLDAKKREESIPSLNPDLAAKTCRFAASAAGRLVRRYTCC